jgi:hypothetical protein
LNAGVEFLSIGQFGNPFSKTLIKLGLVFETPLDLLIPVQGSPANNTADL